MRQVLGITMEMNKKPVACNTAVVRLFGRRSNRSIVVRFFLIVAVVYSYEQLDRHGDLPTGGTSEQHSIKIAVRHRLVQELRSLWQRTVIN